MKLLLVDDDEMERAALRDVLRAQGAAEIVEAADGQKAFELLCDGLEPDICFFDLRMPKLDGKQLLSMLRHEQSLRHLKVVMTSSTTDRDVVMTIGKLGISGYLLKPYAMEKTVASLKQIFGDANFLRHTQGMRNLLGKTILIVDDDPMTRTALKAMIETGPDWEIIEADDGLAALDQLRNGLRPDLLITDLRMPKLDGHNLITRIRETPGLRYIPALVVSGQQDRERIKALVQLRISGYLLKPFSAEKVRSTVKQVLGAIPNGAGEPAPLAKV